MDRETLNEYITRDSVELEELYKERAWIERRINQLELRVDRFLEQIQDLEAEETGKELDETYDRVLAMHLAIVGLVQEV